MPDRPLVEIAVPDELAGESAPGFFLGLWHPRDRLDVRVDAERGERVAGRNWCLISGPARGGPGLLSTAGGNERALAFKGYVLEPPLCSWSPREDLLRYWFEGSSGRHNGVFSAAAISDGGRQLRLTVDAFGISALYYRRLGAVVAFATHSQLLRSADDLLDGLAAVQLLSCGFIPTCRTLNAGVSRVRPGTSIALSSESAEASTWFDLRSVPAGTEDPTDEDVIQVESAFQRAMDKALRLPASNYTLPLSSGDDSRRILASLHHRSVEFSAVTVRVFQGGDRDLDAHWASLMAQAFGFPHTVIEPPSPDAFAQDQWRSLRLFDFGATEHAWLSPMTRAWRAPQTIVFDGLAGDVVCWVGFSESERITLAPPREIPALVSEHLIGAPLPRALSRRYWPSPLGARDDLVRFLDEIPETPNRVDLAFLRARTRGGPGMALQQTVPAGNVVVYPYLELDHVKTVLRFSARARLREPLQGKCLLRFWPEFHRFPGSRRPPATDVGARRPDINAGLRLAGLRRLQQTVRHRATYRDVAPMLSVTGRFAAIASETNAATAGRVAWWLMPCLMVKAWDSATAPALRPHLTE